MSIKDLMHGYSHIFSKVPRRKGQIVSIAVEHFDEIKAALNDQATLLAELEHGVAKCSENHAMQLAGISTAAIGYFKDGDSIHEDYDSTALRDVTKLYQKYDKLFKRVAELEAAIAEVRALPRYALGINGVISSYSVFKKYHEEGTEMSSCDVHAILDKVSPEVKP